MRSIFLLLLASSVVALAAFSFVAVQDASHPLISAPPRLVDGAQGILASSAARGSGFLSSVLGPLARTDDSEGGNQGTDREPIDPSFLPDPDEGFVPCGKRGDGDIVIEEPCNVCHVAEMGQNIINFVLFVLVPAIAIILIAVGGFEMITSGGNEDKYKAGRDRIVKSVIGVVIVLAAWVAVNFLLFTFFKDNVAGNWWSFECRVEDAGPVSAIKPKAPPETSPPPVGAPGTPDTPPEGSFTVRLSATEAKSLLASAGIAFTGTAQLEGIRQSTINEVIILHRMCRDAIGRCPIVVTGGTGGNHDPTLTYSHQRGFKIDIDDSREVTEYIKRNFQKDGIRGDGAQLWINPRTGQAYALESNHWDIEVRPR